jgi:hypothetical protein
MSLSSSSGHPKLFSPRILPPITTAGIAKYQGILAASGVHEIIVSGALLKGETTQNVTYWIIDGDTIEASMATPTRSCRSCIDLAGNRK